MTKYTLEQLIDEAIMQKDEGLVIKAYDNAYFNNTKFTHYFNLCLDEYNKYLKKFSADEEVKRRLNALNHKKQLTTPEIRDLAQIYKYFEKHKIPRDEILYSKQNLKDISKRVSMIKIAHLMTKDYKNNLKKLKGIDGDEE